MLTYILIFYLVFNLIAGYFVVKAYKKYNFERLSISRLGTKLSPLNKLWNGLGLINGILIFLFSYQLNIVSGIIIGFCLVITSVFPWDKYKIIHDLGGLFIFIFQFVFAVDFLINTQNIYLKLPIALAAVSTAFFVFEVLKKFIKNSNHFPKHTWAWEWMIYLSYMVFVLIICL